jgi:O-acetyl-ADP-ribose deacetylase (regulator of RNase III)
MKIGKTHIEALKGDITKINTGAIVNAANPSLMGGGGVDGAIHRNGGPAILKECKEIVAKRGRCRAGEAVITGAGNLPAKYVIHTVGPVWNGGNNNEDILLQNAYTNSLRLAEEHNISSIAFPNISTGVYGYPKELAVKEVKSAISNYFTVSMPNSNILKVLFVCFDDENFLLYEKEFLDNKREI